MEHLLGRDVTIFEARGLYADRENNQRAPQICPGGRGDVCEGNFPSGSGPPVTDQECGQVLHLLLALPLLYLQLEVKGKGLDTSV